MALSYGRLWYVFDFQIFISREPHVSTIRCYFHIDGNKRENAVLCLAVQHLGNDNSIDQLQLVNMILHNIYSVEWKLFQITLYSYSYRIALCTIKPVSLIIQDERIIVY